MLERSVEPFVSIEYLDVIAKRIASGKRLAMSIMGKDPYPGAKTHIPFCKPDWETMLSEDCCGKDVLRSLGIEIATIQKDFSTPEKLFMHLAERYGIVFLNVSYNYVGRTVCRNGKHVLVSNLQKKKHAPLLLYAEAINRNILRASKIVLLLGEAKKHKWYGEVASNQIEVVHPDRRCRISKHEDVREKWNRYWSPHQIAVMFNLDLNTRS